MASEFSSEGAVLEGGEEGAEFGRVLLPEASRRPNCAHAFRELSLHRKRWEGEDRCLKR